MLVGLSRKSSLGRLFDPEARTGSLAASLGAAVAAFERGASIFRVHDVREHVEALAAAGAMFSGAGGAVGVATDAESGLFDRLRSLPIPRSAVLIGRSVADTALVGWAVFVTAERT